MPDVGHLSSVNTDFERIDGGWREIVLPVEKEGLTRREHSSGVTSAGGPMCTTTATPPPTPSSHEAAESGLWAAASRRESHAHLCSAPAKTDQLLAADWLREPH